MAPGVYPFEVMEAVDTFSKAGNEMIKLKLCVFGDDGQTPHIYDYLLEKLPFKLRHFAETTSLLPQYEAGELTAVHCLNREGWVKLSIEEQEGFSPKNSVKDYVENPKDATAPAAPVAPAPRPHQAAPVSRAIPPAAAGHPAFDDDIPPF